MSTVDTPIPMLLWCPSCHARHVDKGEFATKPHHTHACQKCGLPWRPAIVPTVGVQFLPGFKDEVPIKFQEIHVSRAIREAIKKSGITQMFKLPDFVAEIVGIVGPDASRVDWDHFLRKWPDVDPDSDDKDCFWYRGLT